MEPGQNNEAARPASEGVVEFGFAPGGQETGQTPGSPALAPSALAPSALAPSTEASSAIAEQLAASRQAAERLASAGVSAHNAQGAPDKPAPAGEAAESEDEYASADAEMPFDGVINESIDSLLKSIGFKELISMIYSIVNYWLGNLIKF